MQALSVLSTLWVDVQWPRGSPVTVPLATLISVPGILGVTLRKDPGRLETRPTVILITLLVLKGRRLSSTLHTTMFIEQTLSA